MSSNSHPKVVIVGAGFGGLWAARALCGTRVEVVIIDRNNYHTFLPLLYQVATAELEPEDIAYPVRGILRAIHNISFVMAEVEHIDLKRRTVKTNGPLISYDYIILAAGSVSHFFKIPGAADHAFPVKKLEEGITLRNHILKLLERTVYETDKERLRQSMTFTVIGGGATGVEISGALSEFIKGLIKKDYPKLACRQTRVILIEAGRTLLSGFPKRLGGYTLDRLKTMRVDVRLGVPVVRVSEDSITLRGGLIIPTNTVIWTAGIKGNPLAVDAGLPVSEDGRVNVLPTLQAPDNPNVYVIGDLAIIKTDTGSILPMVAQVAMQGGKRAAKNILRQIAGIKPLPFVYRDLGTMVAIGRNSAAVRIGKSALTGFPAWFLWLFVHLVLLIGFRNRLFVLINWAWSYFLKERAIRLILP